MERERRMENRWYVIYKITNSFDGDSYIGCTSQLLKYRLQDHVRNSTRINNKLSIKIRGVGKENLEIIDLVSRWMTRVEAYRIEGQLIDVIEPTLNMKSSGKYFDDDGNYDYKEYYLKNKERVREYNIKNKEHKRDYGRERNSIKTQCVCGGSTTL